MSKKWFLAALLVAAATPAAAHDWYPIECCHAMDCAVVDKVEMVPAPSVTGLLGSPAYASSPGSMIVTTKHGTVIVPANFARRESKDNQMHACMRPTSDGSTLGGMIVTTKHGSVLVPGNFPRRESKDNQMHACMRPAQGGSMRLICIFMPPAT